MVSTIKMATLELVVKLDHLMVVTVLLLVVVAELEHGVMVQLLALAAVLQVYISMEELLS